MPRLIITASATQDLERCRKFLATKSSAASKRASQAIVQQFLVLNSNPNIGRPLDESPELRELVIEFGDSGYVALYRYEKPEDAIYVLAFRHQRETGH